jgi:hypothetical protein
MFFSSALGYLPSAPGSYSGGRVIKVRRWSLTSEQVEVLSLLKYWEQGDARQQHNMQDKELEEKMDNLYLNAHGSNRPYGGAGAQT